MLNETKNALHFIIDKFAHLIECSYIVNLFDVLIFMDFSVKWLNCFDLGTAFIHFYLHECSRDFIRYKGLTIDIEYECIHVCKSMSICL